MHIYSFQVFRRLGKLVDNVEYRGAISMNWLMYDCLLTVLVISKLEAYGFHKNNLALLINYLLELVKSKKLDQNLDKEKCRYGIFFIRYLAAPRATLGHC